ncbi:transglycosylase [Butyricicoccus sp. AF22-28AC]|nr:MULTISPECIES: transglycosylase domain-containing protein [unclassified Butyricicoccus]RGM78493.1 transglycosylase [Butyricicoccus sp. OM06-6AC]RHQ81086.1 transglycosylase [Butyricicoccus sp. AF22-28AC]
MATGNRKGTGIGHLLSRILITLVLIGVLCGCFCGIAFAMYVHIYINPSAQETAAEISKGLGLNLNSFIYAKESDSDEYTLYETIKGKENREWVDSDKIPDTLKNAVVAIEDERFYKHHGVDWVRTIGAVKGWLLGGTQYGGSTITQQLIKNITADNDYSVKRKVNEIFRAFALEKEIDDKDRILVMYLNTIFLGYNSYGVQTAAMQYFDKDVSQLDLAESAVLAGLTNNPSIYDVYNHPEKVKERQETILAQMLDQKMISQEEYEAAVAEELNYRPYEEYQQEIKSTYSYFTDEVIKDVINDLMTEKGYSRLVAENMVYSGGLNIYATIDTKVQNALDEVWANADNFPNTEKYGEIPQSAMVITDKQGNIVGIAGGRGEKTSSRGFSYASDARRQPGSSIKPLATYGPAMDAGIATPDTTVYDRALIQDADGNPWPMNDGKYPTGRAMTVKEGMTRSLNTISAQLLKQLTPQKSYEFMTQQLGFKLVDSRTNEDGTVQSDIDLAPLALGALTDGVTVREMAGGFSTFINDGVYGGTRTYTKVTDSEGNTIMENTPNTDKGFTNVRTDYYMLDCLQNVTAHGTAYGIQLDGVETGGKTGTTTSNTDIWFCGITPKYSGAVWVGYEHNYRLDGLYGRNAAEIWLAVMQKVHAGDSGLVFDSHPQDFEEVTYCMDTGLLASGACRAAGRAATGRFWKDKVPTETCSHQNIENKYDFESMGVDNYYYDDEEDDSDSDSSSSDTDTGNEDSGDGGSYDSGDSGDSGDDSGDGGDSGDDSGDSGDSGGDSGDSGDSSEDPEA